MLMTDAVALTVEINTLFQSVSMFFTENFTSYPIRYKKSDDPFTRYKFLSTLLPKVFPSAFL